MLPRLYEETDWILSRLGLMMGYTSASCVAMHMREMASVVRYEFTSAGYVVRPNQQQLRSQNAVS